MKSPDLHDEPLPYPSIKHRTRWKGCPASEEYLVPVEDKAKVFAQLYPFTKIPSFDATMMDIHENKEFVVRDFKVVREDGMNMLVSPYYYRSGGSVIDWMSLEDDEDEAEVDSSNQSGAYSITGLFGGEMTAQQVKPDAKMRMAGLIHRQHEGRGL